MADLHPEVLKMIEAGPLAVEVDHDTGKVKKREHPQEFARRVAALAVEKEIAEADRLCKEQVAGLERENADLRAKLEEATKDAERYRHLRDHGGADLFGGTASMSIGRHPMIVYFAPSLNRANMIPLFAENADYMVDAAIRRRGKP